LGAATAAYGAGTVRTLLLTYTPALYTAGALCLVAGLIVLTIRRQGAPAGSKSAAPLMQSAAAEGGAG
jgi:hypothetical protein